ncbi:PGF-CTERM-anchored ABC transporter substrate-binding protein [Halorussus salinisoli]|uniref:PGF-CTERM-anchored ABC transporter substrate-binding protein n=1 Tax=Halorussus salinisoli TaxID=2558242 RepID=UPI0010C1746F|nr:PGF-CTERM-anchored ABC transporter substrate-binding protein [Halorussus salinisoli]
MSKKIASVFAVLLLLTAGVAPVGAAFGVAQSDANATEAMQTDCSFPVTSTDATGTEVTVEQKPERVTTLSPSAAQTMWEIGGESQVVGVSQYATYLDGADSRTNVSGAGQQYVNVEKIVSTEPDLVLAPNVIPNETVQQLRDSGLTVYKFEFATSVDDIYAKTTLTGELTGNCEGAAETVSWMEDRIGTVREAVENSDSPRVFVSVGGGWTAGQGTFVSNMVELAGGNNIAAEANVSGYGQISEEVIVEQNPEWIVQLGAFGAYPKTDAYNGTDAVKNDQVITVSDQNISQPAPRVVYAIVQMAQAFHPDAYAEANATTTETTMTTEEDQRTTTTDATETPTEDAMQEQEGTTTATEDDSSGAIPGFGVPAAVAALAGAVLLARRR